jgi:hypothetical protein
MTNNGLEIIDNQLVQRTYSRPHDVVDHKFSVTFFGLINRRLYFFNKKGYYRYYNGSAINFNQSDKGGNIYEKVEFAKYEPITNVTLKSPLFNEGDRVYVPQKNKSMTIKSIERTIEDGSYRIFLAEEYDLIEDEKTDQSLSKAQNDDNKYCQLLDERINLVNKLEKERDKSNNWITSHNIFFTLFHSNPFELGMAIAKQELDQFDEDRIYIH